MDNREAVLRFGVHGKDLYDLIISKENLFAAWREFQIGKKKKYDVMHFAFDFEEDLFDLHVRLSNGTYAHGSYESFHINDPKPREIHKAQVLDRVLHHAIHRVLSPIFDKGFVHDSYSSRLDKGTHEGLERFKRFAWGLSMNNTRPVWILKCDIKRFFDSIDHEILLKFLGKRIDDRRLMNLLEGIIRSFEVLPGKGLPLGNLTSQLFSNVYLNPLDQYIKRTLGVKHYIRYADDFVLLSRDKKELEDILSKIKEFLPTNLVLEIHPRKLSLSRLSQGLDFLGFVMFPHHQLVRTKTKQRMFKKLEKRGELYQEKAISKFEFEQSLQSYLGILSHARTRKLSQRLKNQFWFWLNR